MRITTIHRSAVLCALACTVVMATAGTASARPAPEDVSSPAAAQEAYYQSYGEPQPLVAPDDPAPFDDSQWLLIGLAGVGVVLIAGAGATRFHRSATGAAPRALAQSSTSPATHVTVPPPTQIVPSPSWVMWTRPARPSAVPWRAA